MSINNQITKEEKEKEIRQKLSDFYIQLENKGLVTKSGNIGDQRVSYCRGKDLIKVFNDNKEFIAENIYKISEDDIEIKKNHAIQKFYHVFLNRGMLIKAGIFEEDLKKKFPKKLKPLPPPEIIEFDEKKLYVVNVIREVTKSSYVYLSLIIFLILFVCLFPIWPLWLKIYIWWAMFIFLVAIISLITLRIVIFVLCYTLGYDVWILPNMLSDNLPFFESFLPFFYYDKRQDSWQEILVRFSILVFCVSCTIHIYLYPETFNMALDFIYQIYNDILDWGTNKLTNYHNNKSSLSVMDRHNRIMHGMGNDEY